ncbi:cytochrome oxidase [Aggregicoccus sp. 17bor-14]|uniref:cytochrome oxidase n=1 Tax=Myxococcaceae TaxID=31 RepID=UPI00129CB55D|nr:MULTISPECIES: cytochrome oxidase [Myxococcaceae]MBF5045691.1 cytochrome oxidase [Simulacricoccus sp. 17bor-14]MRI91428.1 cytochrome oxidase [Aggregicoccus sp. 17bor-14]
MSVVILQVFVSLMLVGSSVLLFLVSVRQRDHEHADRLSLIPLEDEHPAASPAAPAESKEPLS